MHLYTLPNINYLQRLCFSQSPTLVLFLFLSTYLYPDSFGTVSMVFNLLNRIGFPNFSLSKFATKLFHPFLLKNVMVLLPFNFSP